MNDQYERYARSAEESWGGTEAYREYERKSFGKTKEELNANGAELMRILAVFGTMKTQEPSAPEVQDQVAKIQKFITEHFYTCSKVILSQLGRMYAAGGEFTANIDCAGGNGTAEFINEAIQIYCR